MFFPEETKLKLFSGEAGGCGFSSCAAGMEGGWWWQEGIGSNLMDGIHGRGWSWLWHRAVTSLCDSSKGHPSTNAAERGWPGCVVGSCGGC